jgi:hypothetical protein
VCVCVCVCVCEMESFIIELCVCVCGTYEIRKFVGTTNCEYLFYMEHKRSNILRF